jgi:hypothetical protein
MQHEELCVGKLQPRLGLSPAKHVLSVAEGTLCALARGISESDKKFALLTQIRIKLTMPGYPGKSLKT